MRGIDEARENLLHEVMSRPFRFLLPGLCATLSLGFTACVGTVYDRMYSYNNTHFRPPPEKKEASAADVLNSLEEKKKAPGADTPPAMPDAVPGLPGAPDPAAPGGMPAIPGLPPSAPPPVPPPPAS